MLKRTLIGACLAGSAMAVNAAETQATFKAAYDAAVEAQKAAAAVGHEWRDIGKMLGYAKAAADKGDFDKAVKLAQTAKQHGELGVEQAKIEADNWQSRVLR